MKKAIGIFDSGVGGLTVLKEIIRLLPLEDTIYLGDTANVPYGIRSDKTILRYSLKNSEFLIKKGIKTLVVACNTASSIGIVHLRERLSLPVIGVITPGAKKAVEVTINGKIGVIGTDATIRSGAYTRVVQELDSRIEVYPQACPLFVPLVEEGLVEGEISFLITKRYLTKLVEKGIDTLVLGCTHYPLLKGLIQKVIGDDIIIIDSAVETAKELESVLKEQNLLKSQRGPGSSPRHNFYITDFAERFSQVGERFLGRRLEGIFEVEI